MRLSGPTHSSVTQTTRSLRREPGCLVLVSPEEADSQLIALERQGITHLTLSRDSDLLLLGTRFFVDVASLSSRRPLAYGSQHTFKVAVGERWHRLPKKLTYLTLLAFCIRSGNGEHLPRSSLGSVSLLT